MENRIRDTPPYRQSRGGKRKTIIAINSQIEQCTPNCMLRGTAMIVQEQPERTTPSRSCRRGTFEVIVEEYVKSLEHHALRPRLPSCRTHSILDSNLASRMLVAWLFVRWRRWRASKAQVIVALVTAALSRRRRCGLCSMSTLPLLVQTSLAREHDIGPTFAAFALFAYGIVKHLHPSLFLFRAVRVKIDDLAISKANTEALFDEHVSTVLFVEGGTTSTFARLAIWLQKR